MTWVVGRPTAPTPRSTLGVRARGAAAAQSPPHSKSNWSPAFATSRASREKWPSIFLLPSLESLRSHSCSDSFTRWTSGERRRHGLGRTTPEKQSQARTPKHSPPAGSHPRRASFILQHKAGLLSGYIRPPCALSQLTPTTQCSPATRRRCRACFKPTSTPSKLPPAREGLSSNGQFCTLS